ncbi:site-specific integrase [Paraburkholderia elongata]|nr:site-specific integrase [Paraburkholderia elongata]
MSDRNTASYRTVQVHHEVLSRIIDILYEEGYRLERVENLGGRHVEVIAGAIFAKGLSPRSLRSYWTEMRYWAEWIGKPGLVKRLCTYLPAVDPSFFKVTVAASSSLSWTEAGLDIVDVIRRADGLDLRLGCMVRIGLSFGLRRRELICLRVHKADKGNFLRVYAGDGPKSGRPRDVPVEHPFQRLVLDYVKELIPKSHFLGWQQTSRGNSASLHANEDRFEKYFQKLEITRAKCGTSAHGMRAEYAENIAMLHGLLPATLGGKADQMDQADLRLRQEEVMECLGHSRVSVASSYYGSFRLTASRVGSRHIGSPGDQVKPELPDGESEANDAI